EIGVTGCAAALAETGTLALLSGPGKPRAASLLPPVHVCIVRRDDIRSTMGEFFAERAGDIASAACCYFITGPSRTADIERAFTGRGASSSSSDRSMRVDAHQHFWRYDASEYGWIDDSMRGLRRDFLPPDLASELTTTGFDACVAVQARQTIEETRWLLELADAHSFIAGVVGWVDLQADDLRATLDRVATHPRLVGVRHIVQSEPDERF